MISMVPDLALLVSDHHTECSGLSSRNTNARRLNQANLTRTLSRIQDPLLWGERIIRVTDVIEEQLEEWL